MIINAGNLAILFRAFKTNFQKGFEEAQSLWDRVATLVPSGTETEDYGWLGNVPGMREWIGDRVINNLKQSDYSIRNKEFELTVGVKRTKIDDDSYGIYAPLMESLGYSAKTHPDELVFALLAAGFATLCYDGQYFFDVDHPVAQADGSTASVSNMQAGAGNPWYLLATQRPLKPIIYQERKKPNFVTLIKDEDPNVFFKNQYVYGVDKRCNVGYGFWQMAFASKDTLNDTNFNAAMAAMSAFKGDYGKPLGITPNLLVVGPSNRAPAKTVVEVEKNAAGADNINFKAVDIMVCPWLP
jgi:phage major head subunit gpT-like protein